MDIIKLKDLIRESSTSINYKIYCDMDGVLVDFEKGYEDLTGIHPKSFTLSPQEFWEPITRSGAKFWIDLPWMPGGKALWNYIKKYKPVLLSAPSRHPSSKAGKYQWVRENIPERPFTILVPAEEKKNYAKPSRILIDDLPKNIQQWEDAGGVGILHTSTQNTISQLNKLGL